MMNFAGILVYLAKQQVTIMAWGPVKWVEDEPEDKDKPGNWWPVKAIKSLWWNLDGAAGIP